MRDVVIVDDDIREIVHQILREIEGEVIAIRFVGSGLLEAIGFPEVFPCLELVMECCNWYNKSERYINTRSGEVLVNINREVIMVMLRIPSVEVYGDWSIEKALANFDQNKREYRNNIARDWLLNPEKGGSYLPRPLRKDHLFREVRDITVMLNKVKGSPIDTNWEDWMHIFLRAILDVGNAIDWAEIIAK